MKMRIKRLGVIAGLVVGMVGLAGCSAGPSTSSDSGGKSAKELNIGVFIQDLSNAYLQAYQRAPTPRPRSSA